MLTICALSAAFGDAAAELARTEERPVEHDADNGAPAVRREIFGAHDEVARSVVHQRRQWAELCFGGVERCREGFRIADVGLNGDTVAGKRRDGLVERFAPASEDRDLRAKPPELERHGAPQSRAAAGDERNATVERALGQHLAELELVVQLEIAGQLVDRGQRALQCTDDVAGGRGRAE